jgi:hypothetical protein
LLHFWGTLPSISPPLPPKLQAPTAMSQLPLLAYVVNKCNHPWKWRPMWGLNPWHREWTGTQDKTNKCSKIYVQNMCSFQAKWKTGTCVCVCVCACVCVRNNNNIVHLHLYSAIFKENCLRRFTENNHT